MTIGRSGNAHILGLGNAYTQLPVQGAANSGLVIAGLGDSRINGTYEPSAVGANSAIEMLQGDTYANSAGVQYALLRRLGNTAIFRDFSVTGSYMSPTGTRTDSLAVYQLPHALRNTDPANTIYFIWSTYNDRNNEIPVDYVIKYLVSAVETIVHLGGRVILALEPPTNVAWQPHDVVWWKTYTDAEYAIAMQYAGRVILADFAKNATSGTGAGIQDGSPLAPLYDGVHPNGMGALFWSEEIWQKGLAAGWWPSVAVAQALGNVDAATDNLVLPMGVGTSSGGISSGTTATNWTCSINTANGEWVSAYVSGVRYNRDQADGDPVLLGDIYSSPIYPDRDYLVVTAGTLAAATPVLLQTMFGNTADGTATVKAVPKNAVLEGRVGVALFGLGITNNNRGAISQAQTLTALGLAVGDKVEASCGIVVGLVGYGYQLAMRFQNSGSTNLQDCVDNMQTLPNSGFVGTYPMQLQMRTPPGPGLWEGYAIPTNSGLDRINFRLTVFSKIGMNQWYFFSAPYLREITADTTILP